MLKICGKLLVSWWCCLSIIWWEERLKILKLLIYNCFIRKKKISETNGKPESCLIISKWLKGIHSVFCISAWAFHWSSWRLKMSSYQVLASLLAVKPSPKLLHCYITKNKHFPDIFCDLHFIRPYLISWICPICISHLQLCKYYQSSLLSHKYYSILIQIDTNTQDIGLQCSLCNSY